MQTGLFVNSQNIDDLNVIESIVKASFKKWQQAFTDPATLTLVEDDFLLANTYQLTGDPALIVNGKYLISGAQPMDQISQAIETIKDKETPIIEVIENNESEHGSCNMENGKWVCTD